MNFDERYKNWSNAKDYMIALLIGQSSQVSVDDINYKHLRDMALYINEELFPEPKQDLYK